LTNSLAPGVRRVLVTGGFGYLGGRVALYLQQRPDIQVVLGTRRCAGASGPSWCPEAEVVSLNWDSDSSLSRALDGIAIVVHAAGSNAQACQANPLKALSDNGLATIRIGRVAQQNGCRRVIYVSTAHVYRRPLRGTLSEETPATNCHPYAYSRRAGEDGLRWFANHGDFDAVILRLSNACGAPAHMEADCWSLVVNDLCRQAVTTGGLRLESSGTQARDFIPLSDVARAVDHCLRLPTEELADGVFNLGSGSSARIIDMAQAVAACCESTLGFRPWIEASPAESTGSEETLDFRVDKLSRTGFIMESTVEDAIKETLLFCAKVFR
jgi:UDP-glucose 4-epimerase